MPDFTKGQQVYWTGNSAKFEHRCIIEDVRVSYLKIFGETPEDGRIVYDLADLVTGITVLGIPAGQLKTVSDA